MKLSKIENFKFPLLGVKQAYSQLAEENFDIK
jgi:hypothetical protein